MAASREKRSNAGNRMTRLLEEEEEDEFYINTYGGFKEVTEPKPRQQCCQRQYFIYSTSSHWID